MTRLNLLVSFLSAVLLVAGCDYGSKEATQSEPVSHIQTTVVGVITSVEKCQRRSKHRLPWCNATIDGKNKWIDTEEIPNGHIQKGDLLEVKRVFRTTQCEVLVCKNGACQQLLSRKSVAGCTGPVMEDN